MPRCSGWSGSPPKIAHWRPTIRAPEAAGGARVVYFSLPVQGHVTPALPVLRELVGRGADVLVCSGERTANALAATGAALSRYPAELDAAVAAPSANFIEVAATLARLTEDTMLAFALDQLRSARPDVVVSDSMAPWGRLAAERLGIATVTLTTSFVISGALAGSLRPAVDAAARARSSAQAILSIAAVRRRLRAAGLGDIGGPLRLLSNRGDATIAFTSPRLQPGARRLGPSVHFVGASLPDAEPAPIGDGKELIYVALGTLYNDRPDFYRACIAALAGPGRAVVLSVGRHVDPEAFGPLPAGVRVHAEVDQLAVLRRAALFISHGGMNSVNEALWHGVPLLLFPQAADQPVVANRIRQLGAGEVLRGREPSARQIALRAASVLAGSAAARSAELGQTLRAGGGATEAASLILSPTQPAG